MAGRIEGVGVALDEVGNAAFPAHHERDAATLVNMDAGPCFVQACALVDIDVKRSSPFAEQYFPVRLGLELPW